jgi:hypothetical protein
LFAVPVAVLCVGLEKRNKKLTLDARNILAGSHTEHSGGADEVNGAVGKL